MKRDDGRAGRGKDSPRRPGHRFSVPITHPCPFGGTSRGAPLNQQFSITIHHDVDRLSQCLTSKLAPHLESPLQMDLPNVYTYC